MVVTTYKKVCVQEERCVTLYDHCGRPYAVRVMVDHQVIVPVRKVVAVYE